MKFSKLPVSVACLLAGGLLWSAPAEATMTRTVYPAHGSTLGYILYTPSDFTTAPAGTTFPVVLFLHGSGQLGDGSTSGLVHVEDTALPHRLGVTHDLDLEAIVIAPQSSSGYWLADGTFGISTVNQAHDVLAEVESTNSLTSGKCDTNRLYVTGLSAGGQGTYLFLKKYFGEVAAAAAVSPSDALDATTAASVATANKPLWSFQNLIGDWPATSNSGPSHAHIAHAYSSAVPDYPTYNATEGFVDAGDNGAPTTGYISGTTGKYVWTLARDSSLNYHNILDAGLTSKNQLFTLFPGGYNHDTWDYVYATQNLYNWLFGQTLNGLPPGGGTGTGLYGQYWNGNNFNNPVWGQVDPQVNFDWGYNRPFSNLPQLGDANCDNWSIHWTGQVQATVTGTYTFTTVTDDGVKLWVNGTQLVNDWTAHAATSNSGTITLQQGVRYDIAMDYYEATGNASAKLYWTPPGGTSQLIPTSQLYPPGTGLKGQYYSTQSLTPLILTRVDPQIDFNWPAAPTNTNGTPISSMPSDGFSVRWTGKLAPVETGTYTFTTTTDDGMRLWVGNTSGTPLGDFWIDTWANPQSYTMALIAGQVYDLKMEYYDATGGAQAQLAWKRPGASTAVVIPTNRLYPAP